MYLNILLPWGSGEAVIIPLLPPSFSPVLPRTILLSVKPCMLKRKRTFAKLPERLLHLMRSVGNLGCILAAMQVFGCDYSLLVLPLGGMVNSVSTTMFLISAPQGGGTLSLHKFIFAHIYSLSKYLVIYTSVCP